MALQGPGETADRTDEPSEDSQLRVDIPSASLQLGPGDGEPILPWDRLSCWLHCICVVGFDLELGQAVEMLWELVLLGESLVVMAPSPAESSETVLALVRLENKPPSHYRNYSGERENKKDFLLRIQKHTEVETVDLVLKLKDKLVQAERDQLPVKPETLVKLRTHIEAVILALPADLQGILLKPGTP
ncbi:Protein DENND6A [Acipenser ruthenus]|uniref:Protein DENND6A n=1 Tax=Acipenser ruthenus TaxID=7906 RepID=A0A662YNF7_ACIRT|nr:Protein DENND6A [Acipenser ruthenus]